MNPLHDLLRNRMGLHAATVGTSLIDRAARARMLIHGFGRQEEYVNLLRRSIDEWNTLVESVVVTESWFFRDRQMLVALVRWIQTEWAPLNPGRTLRVLSLPCASGEEPYSIAMALLDAGVAPEHFRIDAVDISSHALAQADRAIYGRRSFRGADLDFRDRHFRSTSDGYELNPAIRTLVHFKHGNVLDAACLGKPGTYDVIFCRNLLIYFDAGTQRNALASLGRVLKPAGILFTSPAEAPIARASGFTSGDGLLASILRPVVIKLQRPPMPPQISLRSAIKRARLRRLTGLAAKSSAAAARGETQASPPVAIARSAEGVTDLDFAQRLADTGQLAEAARICEAHLRQHGVSARAYYLLGLIRNAAGAESQATEYYRRALYLEPAHHETLVQLALLSEKAGDADRARVLHERAERARRADPGQR